MTVTFVERPGGLSAKEQRKIFDSLSSANQKELLSLTAGERSKVIAMVECFRLIGRTKAQNQPNPVGQAGNMWGNQRAF